MEIILYTDTLQIRSILGLDDKDITDTQITDRNLAKELRLDLSSWFPSHATINASGTEDEKDALTLYCSYFCAALIAVSAQLAAPQKMSDGKDSLERFASLDWTAILASLRERVAFYKSHLQSLTGANVTSAASYSLFSAVGLANDPVTSKL